MSSLNEVLNCDGFAIIVKTTYVRYDTLTDQQKIVYWLFKRRNRVEGLFKITDSDVW